MLAALPAHSIDRKPEGNGSFLVGLRLLSKHVLVIGGNREAASRIFFALDASANVTVVAPSNSLHSSVRHRIECGCVKFIDRQFQASDLDQHFSAGDGYAVDLVLSCVDDRTLAVNVATECRKRRIPVNCADIPDLCDFFFMAQLRQGPLQVGISTNGCGPRLAARIRNDMLSVLRSSNAGAAIEGAAVLRAAIRQFDSVERGGGDVGLRMRWVSKLCDSWAYDELQLLKDDSVLVKRVVDWYASHGDTSVPTLKQLQSHTVSYWNAIVTFLVVLWHRLLVFGVACSHRLWPLPAGDKRK